MIDPLFQAYELLVSEYTVAFKTSKTRARYNPSKLTNVLALHPNGTPRHACGLMWAQLPLSGYFGSKTISYKETPEGLERHAVTVLFNSAGELVDILDANQLTAMRCGLSAVQAIKKLNIPVNSLGLIGFGKVNLQVLHCVSQLCPELKKVVIRDLKLVEPESFSDFEVLNDCLCPGELETCDVLVSATTAAEQHELVTIRGPKLYITFDSGYAQEVYGKIENLHLYSDHPEQLLAHLQDEFPWLEPELKAKFVKDLECLEDAKNLPALVVFYGIALADIAMAVVASNHHKCSIRSIQ